MRVFFFKIGDEDSIRQLGKKLREMPEGPYRVEVKKNNPVRSLKANAYYHVILNLIATESGHSHEKLHELCKRKFNGDIIHLPKGGMEIIANSTSKLDTAEFTAYVNRVKQWAIDEWNITIPEPHQLNDSRIKEIQEAYNRSQAGY